MPNTLTAEAIIERSITAHPALLREALMSRAYTDLDYQNNAIDPLVIEAVKASCDAALKAYDISGMVWVSEGTRARDICAECAPMIIALCIACRLQCIPTDQRNAAASAWDIAHA